MQFKKHIHYDTDLENAILGACLIEKDAIGRVYGMIEKECFYSTGNAIVFETIVDMYKNGTMIDVLTVVNHLYKNKNIETLEGHNADYFVTKMTNWVVSSSHMEYHAHLIKIMWMEREILRLTHGGEKLDGDVREQMKQIQNKVRSLQNIVAEHDWVDMTQLMVDLYRHQDEIHKTGGIGKPSGIKILDSKNGGFQNGQLIVIGARPSVGKTAFAGGMAVEMAKLGFVCGFISLEMSNIEIASRLVAYDTETDFYVVYRGLYRDEEQSHQLYSKIANSTSTLPIYVSDKTKVSIPEIRAKAEKLKSLHGLGCLFIDYLQLVEAVGGSYNKIRENEIAEMSRGCKIMAKELNIPVVLLCQLNREVTKRKGAERYPQLSDLRESGTIEQNSDIVMFLHRDFLSGYETDENGQSTEKQADLVIRKWRNGQSNFIIGLDFDAPKMKFSERNRNGYQPVKIVPMPNETDRNKDEMPF
jgi:replicative DNA helicase